MYKNSIKYGVKNKNMIHGTRTYKKYKNKVVVLQQNLGKIWS